MGSRMLQVAGIAVAVVALCGCGDDTSPDPVDTTPVATQPLTPPAAAQPIIGDVAALRAVLEASGLLQAQASIGALLNQAAAIKDVKAGAALLRRELPARVKRIQDGVPVARRRLVRVQLKTPGGSVVRSLDLDLLNFLTSTYADLNRSVSGSKPVWTAVKAWGKRYDEGIRQLGVRFDAAVGKLPPTERATITKALKEAFG